MKTTVFVFLFLLYGFTGMSQTTRYVAPDELGDGKALSEANAADFLSASFWDEIRALLKKQEVTVRFLAGDYSRAYKTSLLITDMGSGKYRLTLLGDSLRTVFRAPNNGEVKKSQLIKIQHATNVVLKDFKFTGDGKLNYVLNITSDKQTVTRNILIEGCLWEDMKGVIYGATGATNQGTSNVVFKNCTFRRVGLNAGSHMIYNAYSSKYVSVLNSYFEDCTGDYVRFRDKCDYGVVKECTFVHNNKIPGIKFIGVPLYNDGIPYPGNESFATNFAFINNTFSSSISQVYSIFFSNRGYSAEGFNFLLEPQEGAILTDGKPAEKSALLKHNFGIFPQKIRVYGNRYNNVSEQIYLSSTLGYGATSKGWQGRGEFGQLVKVSAKPFSWE